MVDGGVESFQEALGPEDERVHQAVDVGEPLLKSGEDIRAEVEGLCVFFDKAGSVVGDGLALRAAISFDYPLNVHQCVTGCWTGYLCMDQYPGRDLLRDWTSPASKGGWYWTSSNLAILSRSAFLWVESVFSGMMVLLWEDSWLE